MASGGRGGRGIAAAAARELRGCSCADAALTSRRIRRRSVGIAPEGIRPCKGMVDGRPGAVPSALN